MKYLLQLLALILVLVCFPVSDAFAQKKTSSKSKTNTKKTSPPKKSAAKSKTSKKSSKQKAGKAKPKRGRLPTFFAHLELSEDQKDDVSQIQNSYQNKIDKLLEELSDVKSEQQKDLLSVLSRSQKTLYNKYADGKIKIRAKRPNSPADSDKTMKRENSKKRTKSKRAK